MTNTSSLVGSRTVRRLNAASLWVVLVVTVAGAIITLVLGIISIVTDLASRSATLSLIVDRALPSAALGGSHPIARGTYDIAVVHVGHLDSEALGMNATAEIAGTIVQVSLWALIAYLCWRLLHGRALRRSVSTVVGIAGVVLIIGGLVQATTSVIASGVAARQLNTVAGHQFWPLDGRFDFSLTGTGFVLLIVALVFEYGARLQKDTEGLV